MLVLIQAAIVGRSLAYTLVAQCSCFPSGEPHRSAVGVDDLFRLDKGTTSRTLAIHVLLYDDGITVMLVSSLLVRLKAFPTWIIRQKGFEGHLHSHHWQCS
jgi:hypothetical protein